MTETVEYRFLLRRGTAAALAAANEVPMQGEIYLELDTGLGKIGDGTTHYNDLLYSIIGKIDLSGIATGKTLIWQEASSSGPAQWVVGDAVGGVQSVVPGTNISVDNTDPLNPVVSSSLGVITLKGRKATYAALPSSGNTSGDAYVVDADQLIYVWNGTSWPASGSGLSLYDWFGNVPLAASYTIVGTATTFTDKINRLVVTCTKGAVGVNGGIKNLPFSPPYTIDMAYRISGASYTTGAIMGGILLSDGTKYRTFMNGMAQSGAGGYMFGYVESWSTPTTGRITLQSGSMGHGYARCYLRITDDGTNRKFYQSSDRKEFALVYSEATNTFVVPTKVGIQAWNSVSATFPLRMSVVDFTITNAVLGDAS
jgi:hypothetical protein